jgi:hypothetical protein
VNKSKPLRLTLGTNFLSLSHQCTKRSAATGA